MVCNPMSSIQITVNGEAHQVPADTTAARLLDLLALAGQRVAMEINGEIVPRGALSAHRLQEGDRVEVVRAIGGG